MLVRRVSAMPGAEIRVGQWVAFEDNRGKRWCQIDGLATFAEARRALVFEIKYQHTTDAWWQLRWLYEPVVRCLFPAYSLGLVELVHWHDPAITFPEPYEMARDPLLQVNGNSIAVHIWNPKRERY